ncbi:MAG: hypothetical protein HKN15_11530 [Xanthomonadales bacterium]|nr:hypothetical protein [Xanthomonadales bacterium]
MTLFKAQKLGITKTHLDPRISVSGFDGHSLLEQFDTAPGGYNTAPRLDQVPAFEIKRVG